MREDIDETDLTGHPILDKIQQYGLMGRTNGTDFFGLGPNRLLLCESLRGSRKAISHPSFKRNADSSTVRGA